MTKHFIKKGGKCIDFSTVFVMIYMGSFLIKSLFKNIKKGGILCQLLLLLMRTSIQK